MKLVFFQQNVVPTEYKCSFENGHIIIGICYRSIMLMEIINYSNMLLLTILINHRAFLIIIKKLQELLVLIINFYCVIH